MSISARNQANFLYAISELSGKAQQGAEGFTVAATLSAIGISVDSLGLLATPTGGALYLGEEATVWVFPAAAEAVTLGLGVVKHITKAASLKLYIDSFHYAAKADEKETNSTSQMIGENGTRTTSTSTWKNGKVERIDVENPNPGVRPGQIHYHDAYNNKYYYDIEERVFYNQKSGEVAPKTVNELLKDKDFLRGIRKG